MTRLIRSLMPRRALAGVALVAALCGLAACASAPEVRRTAPRPQARVARAQPAPVLEDTAAPAALPMEERDVGAASGFVPAPQVSVAAAAEQLAAVHPPPKVEEAAPSAPSSESESLVGRIGTSTPPNVAAALRLIEDGRQQMNQRHYDRALERFERAVAIDHSNAYGYYFLAKLNLVMKKYDQAIAFAGRATQLARGDRTLLARGYSLQGAAYEEVGRYADARKAYQSAMRADPDNLAARTGIARLNPGERAQ